MITVLNFIAFWTLQLKLFPWPVTSPLLTVSSGQCGGWGALAYAFMLTGSFATNVPRSVLFTVTSARLRTVTEVNTIGNSALASASSRTVATDVLKLASFATHPRAARTVATHPRAARRTATHPRAARTVAKHPRAIFLSRVNAAALYFITGVGLSIAITEATDVSVTTPTLDPRMDTGGAVPIIEYNNMALPRYFTTTAVLKPHSAATDNSSASYAAAEDQAGPLTQNYSATSAA